MRVGGARRLLRAIPCNVQIHALRCWDQLVLGLILRVLRCRCEGDSARENSKTDCAKYSVHVFPNQMFQAGQ